MAKSKNVTLALIAAAAPILSGVASVYHERNVAAATQAKRDEALLKALTDCVALQRAPAPTPAPPAPAAEYAPAPPPPPTASIRPKESTRKLEAEGPPLRSVIVKEPSATAKLDALARNYGWQGQ